jgi:N-acetyl sugar amidotransferase
MMSKTSTLQRPYQICARCVMDTSDPFIRFDTLGHCNHCTDFLSRRLVNTAYLQKDSKHLNRIFTSLKSRHSTSSSYDVLVGVSGGVDSSMVVLLAQQAGLRVLAVHMDNGWDTPVALQNVYKLVSLPGISYHSEVLDWNNFKKVQRAFIEAGVPDIELPTDIAIQSVLHRVASKYQIPVILSGGNIVNEGILPASWMYNPRDSLYAYSIVKRAGLAPSVLDDLKFGFRQEFQARMLNRICTIYPLNYFRYDKESARLRLAEHLAWQSYGGKHCESTFTRFTQLIYHPRRHGIDFRRGYLSADICVGSVSREDALAQLERPAWADLDTAHDISFVARKLDYTASDLMHFMESQPLWYTDFPNRERLLGLAYDTFRFLTGRRKASNF